VYTLDPRYNMLQYNMDSVTIRLKSRILIFHGMTRVDNFTTFVNRTCTVLRATKWADALSTNPLGPAVVEINAEYTRMGREGESGGREVWRPMNKAPCLRRMHDAKRPLIPGLWSCCFFQYNAVLAIMWYEQWHETTAL